MLTRSSSKRVSPAQPGEIMQVFSESFLPFIKAVGRGEKRKRDLTLGEAREAMRLVANRQASPAQVGAFLVAQRIKGEALEEVLGFTATMRTEFIQPCLPRVQNLLDMAVPYDGKAKTAQLAPLVALVLAEAGLPVLLHGMQNVPTKAGITPADILSGLGVNPQLPLEAASRMVETVGIGYVDACKFSPAWHALLPIRHHFGLRTVFNTIEKFFNPANAPFQVTGFFHANYIERIRTAQTGLQASWMIQGEEGSVEIAAGRRTHVYAAEAQDDWIITPDAIGMPVREKVEVPPIAGAHLSIIHEVLSGRAGPAFDQVCLTAGVILALVGAAASLEAGLSRVRRVLKSGDARARLEKARSFA